MNELSVSRPEWDLSTDLVNRIDLAIVGWLHTKFSRSGSAKTAKAYDDTIRDFRTALRVIRQWAAGKSVEELVNVFEVSIGTARRWIRQYQENGQVATKQRQRWQGHIGPAQEEMLRAQVQRIADATLEQHVVEWEKTQGIKISLATMWRALKRIGWSLKKDRGSRGAR